MHDYDEFTVSTLFLEHIFMRHEWLTNSSVLLKTREPLFPVPEGAKGANLAVKTRPKFD